MSPLQHPFDFDDPQTFHLGDVETWFPLAEEFSIVAPMSQEPLKLDQTFSSRDQWTNAAAGSLSYPQQEWPDHNSAVPTSMTPHPTPTYCLPIQHPEPVRHVTNQDPIPLVAPKKEPMNGELIGMGLYEAPEDSKMHSQSLLTSSLSFARPTDMSPASVGKGLKLEETWDPLSSCTTTDNLEDGEGEVVDFDAEQIATGGVQPANTSSLMADLANRSFFLDDDTAFVQPQQNGQLLTEAQSLYALGSGVGMGGAAEIGWI